MDNPSNEQSDEIPEFFLEKKGKTRKKENKQKIIWFEKKI